MGRKVHTRSVYPVYPATRNKQVWLTIDDGPHSRHTPEILRVLEAYNIKAVFFLLGQNATRLPALVDLIAQAGHRIGNHSFSHPDLTRLSARQIRSEIGRTDGILRQVIVGEKLFRPPYGSHNAFVDGIAKDLGYRTVLWNVDTRDWDQDYQPRRWITHGIDQMERRTTAVVLTHDIHPSTSSNYERFVRRILALGNVSFPDPFSL